MDDASAPFSYMVKIENSDSWSINQVKLMIKICKIDMQSLYEVAYEWTRIMGHTVDTP